MKAHECCHAVCCADDLIARNEMKIFIIRNFPFIQFNDDDFAFFHADAIHKKGLNVASWSHNEVWRVDSDR